MEDFLSYRIRSHYFYLPLLVKMFVCPLKRKEMKSFKRNGMCGEAAPLQCLAVLVTVQSFFQDMCFIEGALEVHLGEFHVKMKGRFLFPFLQDSSIDLGFLGSNLIH